MKCHKCRHNNAEGVRFCAECGAKLESFCPKGRAKLPLRVKSYGRCERSGVSSRTTGRIGSASSLPLNSLKPVAVAIGSIMILISLALPWYSGYYEDFGVGWLLKPLHWMDDEPLFGLALPVVYVMIFAFLALVSVFWFPLKRNLRASLLIFMSILAIVCLCVNAVYTSLYLSRSFGYDFESGFILSLVGTIIVLAAAALDRTRE